MERTASIEEHVTCSICMDLYNDPLALPCLHSFCRRCIHGLFSSALVFKCPECRNDVKLGQRGVDDLPRNFQLAGIVDIYKKENASKESRGLPRDGPPSCAQHRMTCQLMCNICKIPVCLRCVVEKHSGHKMALLSARKDREDTNTDELKCLDHSRVYKLYCGDCEKLICLECIVRQHYTHHLNTIEGAYTYNTEALRGTLGDLDVRVRLLRATQKTCRTLAQKTQLDAQKRRQEMSVYFTRLREALDRRESELRSELDHREQKICQTYMTHSESAMRKEKLVATATDDVRRLCTENKMKLLQSYQSKIQRTSALLGDETADCPPQMKGVDDVTLVTCSLEKELANVHWKWPKEELKPTRRAPPVPAARKSVSDRKPKYSSRIPEACTLPVGTPVKRGKCWRDGTVDGGPGHIGTVTQICLDPDTYTVRWPNGKSGNYKYSPPYEEEVCPP